MLSSASPSVLAFTSAIKSVCFSGQHITKSDDKAETGTEPDKDENEDADADSASDADVTCEDVSEPDTDEN